MNKLKSGFYRLPLYGFSFLLMISSMGCKRDVEQVDFLLNEKSVKSNEIEPAQEDSTQYLTAYVGDTIYVKDISSPEKNVKSRKWDWDGDGQADLEDKTFFPVHFDQAGMTKITLFVNDEKPGVSKWIYVKYNYPEATGPVIVFESPYDGEVVEGERKIKVEATVENVESEESVVFKVNSKNHPFSFDSETGELTAEVRLSRGENAILLEAENTEGTDSESLTVTYGSSSGDSGKLTADPAPAPAKPSVEILNDFSRPINTNWVDLKIKSANGGSSDLLVKLNGETIPSKKLHYSKSKRIWIASLKPVEGKNEVLVYSSNDLGSDSKFVTFTYASESASTSSSSFVSKEPSSPPSGDFNKAAVVGLSVSSYSENCGEFTNNTFSVTLSPKTDLQLKSFKLFTDECGKMQVSLSGGGLSESFSAALNGGRSQVSFGAIDADLKANNTYTLTCKASTGAGCAAEDIPKFKNAEGCNASEKNSPQLSIKQPAGGIIYDLKFSY